MRRPRWLTWWTDHSGRFRYSGLDEDERRSLVLTSLEDSGYGWQIVFVAGFGFLADAYDIFSINTISPIISIIYWHQNELPTQYRLGLNLSTLLGSMVGQVVLGYLADRVGRRKVYGLELAFTILASFGLATASQGAFDSMSLIGILIFWRLVMGIGIGSDYPLSAVLTAEFAPSKHRDSMLASVFFFQPLGQLIAVLIAFATTAGWKSYVENIQAINGPQSCTVQALDPAGIECARTLDRSWRMIAGLGAVPAVIAIYFRFTIPESVYYTLDVREDSARAANDAARYYGSAGSSAPPSVASDHESIADNDASTVPRFSSASSYVELNPAHIDAVESANTQASLPANEMSGTSLRDFSSNQTPNAGTAAPVVDPSPNGPMNANGHTNLPVKEEPDSGERGGFLSQYYRYLSRDGNWKDLFATSVNWMLLDFTFYLLGVNSSSFIPKLFREEYVNSEQPYLRLIHQERHIMESSSAGSLVGSLLTIGIFSPYVKSFLPRFINSPRKIQTWGFGALAIMFVIVGSLYITLSQTKAVVAIVFFYELCQFFFNLGPNTTTFMIPAQVFPTRFRCFSYGIAAASGKFGSVLGQIVVTKVESASALGGTMIGFALLMIMGSILSATLSPETCVSRTGKTLPLKDTAYRNHRQRLAFQNPTSALSATATGSAGGGHEMVEVESRRER